MSQGWDKKTSDQRKVPLINCSPEVFEMIQNKLNISVDAQLLSQCSNSLFPLIFQSAQVLTEAEIHTSLSRGAYPSHEKLNDEIHSEPRIYECQEDIELAIYNGLAPAHQYHNIRSQQPPIALSSHSYLYKPNPNARREVRRQHPQQAYYHSAPRLLTNKRTSYSSSIGMFEDNHLTDYGFAPWQQRPNSVCAMRAGSISSSAGFGTALSIARPKYAPSNLSWKGHVPDNYSCEILHVWWWAAIDADCR